MSDKEWFEKEPKKKRQHPDLADLRNMVEGDAWMSGHREIDTILKYLTELEERVRKLEETP